MDTCLLGSSEQVCYSVRVRGSLNFLVSMQKSQELENPKKRILRIFTQEKEKYFLLPMQAMGVKV
jgi:hypothetical protein